MSKNLTITLTELKDCYKDNTDKIPAHDEQWVKHIIRALRKKNKQNTATAEDAHRARLVLRQLKLNIKWVELVEADDTDALAEEEAKEYTELTNPAECLPLACIALAW